MADAIIRSQAMLATTIVEYYVEDTGVAVELEVGLRDLEAFRNLLPDELYERLGHPAQPLSERLERFFGEDLVIQADGEPLQGLLHQQRHLRAMRRVLGIAGCRREVITGCLT